MQARVASSGTQLPHAVQVAVLSGIGGNPGVVESAS